MKPILFNTEMVKAIIDGRKTQTRRLVKPNFRSGEYGFQIITNTHTGEFVRIEYYDEFENETRWMKQPYEVGDILWVRETWCDPNPENPFAQIAYKADFPMHWDANQTEHGDPITITAEEMKWKPSIHMPKEAARIFLHVKNVYVERLQSIDGMDVLAEGVDNGRSNPAMGNRWENMQRMAFARLWNSTIKNDAIELHGWQANPWVWVIEFERCNRDGTNLRNGG